MKPQLPSQNQKGFTLIEIMIVLGIFAGVVALSSPSFFKKKTKVLPTVRKMQLLSKQLHRIARVQKKTFRWVIQLDDPDNELRSSYWVESAPAHTKILTPEELEDLNEDQLKEHQGQFREDTSFFKEKIILPEGLSFDRIESINYEEPVENGKAYIYYFSNGLAEETAIHIKNNDKLNWTLAIHPLTGHVNLIRKDVSLEDIADRD